MEVLTMDVDCGVYRQRNLPCIEHSHEPEYCQFDQRSNALVKIDKDVTKQLDVVPAKSLPTVTSARNMRARPAKPLLQSRNHQQSLTAAWLHPAYRPG